MLGTGGVAHFALYPWTRTALSTSPTRGEGISLLVMACRDKDADESWPCSVNGHGKTLCL